MIEAYMYVDDASRIYYADDFRISVAIILFREGDNWSFVIIGMRFSIISRIDGNRISLNYTTRRLVVFHVILPGSKYWCSEICHVGCF